MSSTEVHFEWNDRTVNLKVARLVVRFLAEHHSRLGEIGPTQCLRDILEWFKHCDPAQDESFRALEKKHGQKDDFDNVCQFLKAYKYEDLKRLYPKQCGSLWMAVRGVLRRRNQHMEAEQGTLASKTSDGSRQSTQSSQSAFEPSTCIRTIREGSDEIAYELLMLMSTCPGLSLDMGSREQLEHAEQTLMTAVEDLRLILREFKGGNPEDVRMKSEDHFDGGDPASENPDSPDSGYPSSPSGSTSGESGFGGGFARGNGSPGPGGYSWQNSLSERFADVTLKQEPPASAAEPPVLEAGATMSKRLSKRLSLSAAKKVGKEGLKRLSTRKSKSLYTPSAFGTSS